MQGDIFLNLRSFFNYLQFAPNQAGLQNTGIINPSPGKVLTLLLYKIIHNFNLFMAQN